MSQEPPPGPAHPFQLTCATCRYWQSSNLAPSVCRRYPPTPVVVRALPDQEFAIRPKWPETMGHEWCGEHWPTKDQ
jgi:hypothetical protein